MQIKVAQVIGLNSDQKAAQVISSVRDNDNTFFAVLDLSCDDAFTKGRQILSELSDFYFDFEGSPSEKLNATSEEVKGKFPEEEYSLLLSSISGKVLYLLSGGNPAGKGDIEVHLKRNEKLSSLLSLGSESQLISGFLQEGDRLLLSTKSLVNFLGEDLSKSLDLSTGDFEQEITDRIGSTQVEQQSLAGLAIEMVGETQEKEVIPGIEEEQRDPYQESSAEEKGNIFGKALSVFGGVLNFIKNYFPKSGRGRLILAVLLILIIASGVGVKIKASKDAEAQAQFNQYLQSAKDDFNGAKGLASLNPVEAKSKLDSSLGNVDKAIAIKPKNTEALDLKKQIEGESGSILKQSEVSDFPVFLDLDLVKSNFRASQMSLSSGKLLLLDSSVGTLISIDIAKKSNQILAGKEQLGDAALATLNGTTAFIYSGDKGILKIDTSSKKVTTALKTDDNLGEVKDIYGFASNIYVLDAGKNMVWKYLATSDGYSTSREYFTKGTTADLKDALRMQIESSIYILKSGGEILRFTKGDKDNFGYSGLPSGVKDPKSIFVSSDTDDFYVLDSGNSRLLILTKTGTYKGTITGAGFANASDLVVDEKGKKVYLLEGSKIYSVDLK